MKYFVTGATGFIGSRVVRQLRGSGHDVIALVRNLSAAQPLADQGIQLAEGDVTDKQSMRAPMTGVDGAFHIAGWYKVGGRHKEDAEAINVDGTRNFCELMRELKTPRGLYVSTLQVYGDTGGELKDESFVFRGKQASRYGETKWRAHHEVAAPAIKDGLPLIIVQPGVVIGPEDPSIVGQMLRLYLRGRLPLTPKGSGYCWTYIDDQVQGCLLAIERGTLGETYNLGGPAVTLVDAFALAQKITGLPAPIFHPSPSLMRAMSAIQDVTGVLIPWPDTFSGEILRMGLGETVWGSSAKAERELGWKPRPLEESLRLTLEYELGRLGKRLKG